MTASQPRRSTGEFTFKTFADADAVNLVGPAAFVGQLDPEEVFPTPPEHRIGLHFQGMTEIDGEDVETWSSGNGSYETQTWRDGHTQFTLDGDLHRTGGPALIGAGLPGERKEDWFLYGARVAAAHPSEPAAVILDPSSRAPTRKLTGQLFEYGRGTAVIARDVRRGLDTLTDIGFLPTGSTVKVTSTSGSKGKSVNVTVGGLEKGYAINPETLEFTAEGRRLRDHIDAVVQQYNQWEEGPSASHSRRGFWNEVHLLESA